MTGAAGLKLLGIFLLLAAGFLSGMKIVQPLLERIELLREGRLLFRILESEIRTVRTPLPQLFRELSGRTSSCWHDFFFRFPGNFRKASKSLF